MSKQSDAKEAQNYRRETDSCAKCAHFQSDIEFIQCRWTDTLYKEEKNIRCGLGGFKVHKTAVCDKFTKNGGAA